MGNRQPNRWKGFVLGTLGGVVGALMMQAYWQIVTAYAGLALRKQEKQNPTSKELHVHSLGAHLAYGAGCALGTQALYWLF